jgi:hypothetical protein
VFYSFYSPAVDLTRPELPIATHRSVSIKQLSQRMVNLCSPMYRYSVRTDPPFLDSSNTDSRDGIVHSGTGAEAAQVGACLYFYQELDQMHGMGQRTQGSPQLRLSSSVMERSWFAPVGVRAGYPWVSIHSDCEPNQESMRTRASASAGARRRTRVAKSFIESWWFSYLYSCRPL